MSVKIEGAFPNIGVLGYYRPHSQTVHIACASQEEASALDNGLPVAAHQFLTTVNHELTHWLDHTSTLCGQEYLVSIYNAAHALSPQVNGAETEYWRGMALRDLEEALVTQRLWAREHIARAYAKDLLIYSAPTHLLSIRIGTQDIEDSYAFAAAAAHYCLNLPRHCFAELRSPEAFGAFGQRRLAGFQANADRGYLFAVLAGNGPPYRQGLTAQQWVNAAARASNLPSIADLSPLAMNAMNAVVPTLLEVEDKGYVESILEIGRRNFFRRLAEPDPAVTPSRLTNGLFQLPPAIFDDGGIYETCRSPNLIEIPETTLENMVAFGHYLDKLMTNFQGACR